MLNTNEEELRKRFTVEHPFLCALIATLIALALPFAIYFPPLVYVFSVFSDATLGVIMFNVLPFVWLFVCVFLVGRSYIYRKAGL